MGNSYAFRNTKWKKGVSGNPKGRKKGLSLTTLFKEELAKVPEGERDTVAEAFVKKMLEKAQKSRDTALFKLIWNYVDGFPKSNVAIGGEEDGKPIKVKVIDSYKDE
jgi:hypothetical protein